jgi:hypothetical protein
VLAYVAEFILLYVAEKSLKEFGAYFSWFWIWKHFKMFFYTWSLLLAEYFTMKVLKSAWLVVIILYVTLWNEAMESRDMLWQYWLMVFPLSTTSCLHVCSGRERFNWIAHISASGFSLQVKGEAHELGSISTNIFITLNSYFLLPYQCTVHCRLILFVRYVTCPAVM